LQTSCLDTEVACVLYHFWRTGSPGICRAELVEPC
jgi:hypothetical protein